MTWNSLASAKPLDLMAVAFSLPAVSFACAVVITLVMVVAQQSRAARARDDRSEAVHARYVAERRTLAIGAIVVIAVFLTENFVRGYALQSAPASTWWRFTVPLACAVLVIAASLVLMARRGVSQSEEPVLLAERRTWLTFGSRAGMLGGAIAILLLLATTILAGLASSADSQGRHVWLEIAVPNEPSIDPIRTLFPGWFFGVPVLICLVALVACAGAALQVNATRPYLRPGMVVPERAARGEIATGVLRIATAGALLALAGSWRLIADAASVSSLEVMGVNDGNPYEAAWRFAEFADVAGWLAPLVEIVAFVLLMLVARRLLSGRSAVGAAVGSDMNVGTRS